MAKEKIESVVTSVRMPSELYEAARAFALATGTNFNQVAVAALTAYIKGNLPTPTEARQAFEAILTRHAEAFERIAEL